MFRQRAILIVEDQPLIGLSLAHAVADHDGHVIGPAETVCDALLLLDSHPVAAAILDALLPDRDVTPVALRLLDRGIPFVLHSATGLPLELAVHAPDLPLIRKPLPAPVVVQRLWQEMCAREPGSGELFR